MWDELPKEQREEYKRMILAFASLSEMFAQKADTADGDKIAPIVNSKYQETVFQKAFNGFAEDIGNTSYDVSIHSVTTDGTEKKYLVGIKTFGINSGDQKIAQFKQYNVDWAETFAKINQNAVDEKGVKRNQNDINNINEPLYHDIAKKIAEIRNKRIDSSIANLQGFQVRENDSVESVYHVLMPSAKNEEPSISVGETSYNHIDINKLEVLGCTSDKHPMNFQFTDGKHIYKFTQADSQLLMKFNNKDIVKDVWQVKFVDDAYAVFSNIADQLYGLSENKKVTGQYKKTNIEESYSWKLVDENGQTEIFSGFNSFYGVGSKLGRDKRMPEIFKLTKKFQNTVSAGILSLVEKNLTAYLMGKASSYREKFDKVRLRDRTVSVALSANNHEFVAAVRKLMYRPKDEVYISIPNSKAFHAAHPEFFIQGADVITVKKGKTFNLVFEPSGTVIKSFITQDFGKAIESAKKQSLLGEWILRGVFQLDDYEPLTGEHLKEVGINGIRLYKLKGSPDVHLEFIWIDDEELPDDYWE